jgi:hypothetical protein
MLLGCTATTAGGRLSRGMLCELELPGAKEEGFRVEIAYGSRSQARRTTNQWDSVGCEI